MSETETTSGIFHFVYIVKLISQGQNNPSLATAKCIEGNASSFFLPQVTKNAKRKEIITKNDDSSLSQRNVSNNNPLEDLENVPKNYP